MIKDYKENDSEQRVGISISQGWKKRKMLDLDLQDPFFSFKNNNNKEHYLSALRLYSRQMLFVSLINANLCWVRSRYAPRWYVICIGSSYRCASFRHGD